MASDPQSRHRPRAAAMTCHTWSAASGLVGALDNSRSPFAFFARRAQ
jgi:hypothetical protein